MVQHVHGAFRSIIQSTLWMDEITKSKAINKTDSMKRFISFPEALNDKKIIDDFYSNVRGNLFNLHTTYMTPFHFIFSLKMT